jgi:transposase
MRKPYPTDLSDTEWACLEPHLPTPNATERPRIHPLREVFNAIFYIVRSGCAWRLLPHEFPPWKTIHHYFRIWRIDGTGQSRPPHTSQFHGRSVARTPFRTVSEAFFSEVGFLPVQKLSKPSPHVTPESP